MTQSLSNRRPIRVRSTAMARIAAETLARAGVTADQISLASLLFAVLAAVSLLLAPVLGSFFYLLAAIMVPLRLAANLLDGMVAVENRKGSALGPIFNEWPDRVADVVILASAGYAAGLVPGQGGTGSLAVFFGWLSAVLAVLTAYAREFGRAEGMAADFGGPFAKQQRMWAVIAGALVAFLLPRWAGVVLALMLFVVAAGTAYTLYLRTMRLARFMRATFADEPEPEDAWDFEEDADEAPVPLPANGTSATPRPQPQPRAEPPAPIREAARPPSQPRAEPQASAPEAARRQPQLRPEPQAPAREAPRPQPGPRAGRPAPIGEPPRARADPPAPMREAARLQPRPRTEAPAPLREVPRPRAEPQAPRAVPHRPGDSAGEGRTRRGPAPLGEATRPQPQPRMEPEVPNAPPYRTSDSEGDGRTSSPRET